MFAVSMALFISFVTWLTTGVSSLSVDARYWVTSVIFIMVAALMTSYLLCCMSRHCDEDSHRH
jgi:hypothetical protein